MRIRLESLVALVLIALLIFVAVKVTPIIADIFEEMNEVYTYGPGRMLIKFMFFGLICITIVVTAKFMSRR